MGKVQVDKVKKSFDLRDKKRILDAVKVAKAKGESVRSVSKRLKIHNSTLCSILKNEKAILERLKANPNSKAKV